MSLAAAGHPLASTTEQLRVLSGDRWKPFSQALEDAGLYPLTATGIRVFQINVGKLCNQTCRHCHVDAGPDRRETMSRETAELCIAALQKTDIPVVDITGGAPELNANFRWLVTEARAAGRHVMDRCNLTVVHEPGQHDLPAFLAEHGVEVVASLPCYLEENVDRQRGKGVFEGSLRALRAFNALGYGRADSDLVLNLVYNPQGPVLPPAQEKLERDYRDHLLARYDIAFNHLYVLTNMPIQRFGSTLVSKGLFEEYLALLKNAYQPGNLESVMCRSLVSVDWRGYLYDCDFNQMLDLPLAQRGRTRTHLRDVSAADLEGGAIAIGEHCYGCTAGQGSSCGGALG